MCLSRYAEYRSYAFDAGLSCGGCNQDDLVTVVNAPLVGVLDLMLAVIDSLPLSGLRNDFTVLLNDLINGVYVEADVEAVSG